MATRCLASFDLSPYVMASRREGMTGELKRTGEQGKHGQQRSGATGARRADLKAGDPTLYTCPDCGGVLSRVESASDLQFACHIGHEWRGDRLASAKSHAVEQAIYEAIRTLREKAMLLRQLAVISNPRSEVTAGLIEQADQDDEHARLLATHLLGDDSAGPIHCDTTDDLLTQMAQELRRRADD
jgi:two-component system, chemotaxis family, protein-glutamate methylesterase/glutaminase